MKRTIYIAWWGLCLGWSACQSDEPVISDDAASHIYLAAEVESALVQSRTPYWLSMPASDNPLYVNVWAASTSSPDYIFKNEGKNGSEGTVALHTEARFTNGSAQLLNQAVYPKNGGVYFVGMHPRGWETETGENEGKSAFYTFDGSHDVMFAPHILGTYGQAGVWPKFKFKHLLTWLRIEFVADNEAVSEAWGKVTNMTIESKNQVAVNLNQEYPSTKMHDETGASVNFSGEENMRFYQTDTDDVFPSSDGYAVPGPLDGTNLAAFIQEKAYVLCAPVKAEEETNEYTITITTDKRTVEVDVNLKKDATSDFTGTTMGYQFTVLLHFKMGGNISVSALATDWINGGMGMEDVDEEDIQTNNS